MTEVHDYKPMYLGDESVAHLAASMRAKPGAESWHYTVDWAAGFGSCVEDVGDPAERTSWSATWPTYRHTSASLRLTPPPEQRAELTAFLARQTEAHCEAVGGPLDGFRYHVDVYPTQMRLTIVF